MLRIRVEVSRALVAALLLHALNAKEAAVDNFLTFAEIASAIIASIGLALCLEWLSLHWLMRLMPQRPGQPPARRF